MAKTYTIIGVVDGQDYYIEPDVEEDSVEFVVAELKQHSDSVEVIED